VISNLNPRKPLGYNHIASKILNVLLEWNILPFIEFCLAQRILHSTM
jgi:hypothetical protein